MPAFKPPKRESSGVITIERPMHGQHPSMLDIIKLDGRWAQIGSTDMEHPSGIRYLADNSGEVFDPETYKLKGVYKRASIAGITVKVVMEAGMKFSRQELENIRWGPEQEKHPELKLLVTVFGEYESRKAKK